MKNNNKKPSQQGGFSPLKTKKEIKWIYSPSRDWSFWFVDVEGQDKWYYVHFLNKKDALPWDEVLAKIKTFKWRDEAVIKRILKRSDKVFSWTFEVGKKEISKRDKKEYISFGFVKVRDDNFSNDIFIPWKYVRNAKEWDFVWVQIVDWTWKNPKWKIVEVFWNLDKNEDLIIESFIREAWFREKFSREVLTELRKLPKNVDIKKALANKNRKNLRKFFTFTIDWEDAKDLDDAISIFKRQNWNIELYVHIADVTNYVREDNALDKEALYRATSVYLPDRVIAMLPKELSNNLCSLNLDWAKLSLTCEMIIGKDGVIRKTKVYESLIKSDFRLTYKEVDEIKNWKIKIWDKLFCGEKATNELFENIKNSWELKDRLEKARTIKWNLDFDFPETKIILDENKNVVEIKQYPKYESNKMIELFMVSANYSISKMFKDLPFLHRIHPEPTGEDIEKLQQILHLFWINFRFEKFTTKEYQKLLELIEKSPNKAILEKSVLRSLTKAIYSPDNEGHFGLGLDYYSHFTSPIRRYPDLQIHRIIKEKLAWKLDKNRINHYKTILKNIATHCSDRERAAEQLEYKVKDYFICKYYRDKIWEKFEAMISWIIPKWFFVMLEDTSEGFVDLTEKRNFIYNEELMQFEDKITWKKYKIWDKLEVKLVEVDMKLLRLNFEIV